MKSDDDRARQTAAADLQRQVDEAVKGGATPRAHPSLRDLLREREAEDHEDAHEERDDGAA